MCLLQTDYLQLCSAIYQVFIINSLHQLHLQLLLLIIGWEEKQLNIYNLYTQTINEVQTLTTDEPDGENVSPQMEKNQNI